MVDTKLNYDFGYSVIGYDKNNDVFIKLSVYSEFNDAVEEAKRVTSLSNSGRFLKTLNGGQIDWIEVYHNYELPGEELMWASYRDLKEKENTEADRMRYIINGKRLTQINIEIECMDEDYTAVFLVPENESDECYHKLRSYILYDERDPSEAAHQIDDVYYMCSIYDDRIER